MKKKMMKVLLKLIKYLSYRITDESNIHVIIWDMIARISDIKASYNYFDNADRPKYHACCQAIKALRELIGVEEPDITPSKIDMIISIMEEWKQNSDVVSCDSVIDMLKAK